uniref:Uncharacterized protein n=1 Tax=Rhizophora mucronata TaxID=61149 RepID=A0A2P2NES3_RHIMU
MDFQFIVYVVAKGMVQLIKREFIFTCQSSSIFAVSNLRVNF